MKKLITLLSLAVVFTACKKEGEAAATSSADLDLKQISKLGDEAEQAAYGYGVNLGMNLEQTASSPIFAEDSLNDAAFIKGYRDYLSGDKNKLSYLFGQSLAKSVEDFKKQQKIGDEFDSEVILSAMFAKYKKDSLLMVEDSIRAVLSRYTENNLVRLKNEGKAKSEKFLADKKKASGVQATPSGLLYEVKSEGSGEKPNENSLVKINYKGSTTDGKVFDETKGEPIERPVGIFVPGFSEGLKLMSAGSKYTFYIPAELAYGENGQPRAGIGPNEVLVFDVELLEVREAPEQGQNPQIAPPPPPTNAPAPGN